MMYENDSCQMLPISRAWHSHMNLVGDALRKRFNRTNKFVKAANAMQMQEGKIPAIPATTCRTPKNVSKPKCHVVRF